jgi:hypothetical protein
VGPYERGFNGVDREKPTHTPRTWDGKPTDLVECFVGCFYEGVSDLASGRGLEGRPEIY